MIDHKFSRREFVALAGRRTGRRSGSRAGPVAAAGIRLCRLVDAGPVRCRRGAAGSAYSRSTWTMDRSNRSAGPGWNSTT